MFPILVCRLSASDVDACFREYDRDRDNRLNFAEFCVMMNAKHHSAQESKKKNRVTHLVGETSR